MKSFHSVIRYVNNPFSKENIAIGLLVFSEKKMFFKFSASKIKLVQKINPDNFKLFEYTLEKIQYFINHETPLNSSFFKNDSDSGNTYLNRLSIYNNGFIQFDKPVGINMEFDNEVFSNFFDRFIEVNYKKIERKYIDEVFIPKIRKAFSEPLEDVIDINVKIKKEQIPGLYFDYVLDGIGVNEIVYSVKSIDLNSERPIDSLKKEIAEFESLNYRINSFVAQNVFSLNNPKKLNRNKHFLVIDEYVGKKDAYRKLYDILSESDSYNSPYKVIGTDDLGAITAEIKNSNTKKFSEVLASLNI